MKIELCNLEKHFGMNTAVDIKSFTINNGDILGLVGTTVPARQRCSALCSTF